MHAGVSKRTVSCGQGFGEAQRVFRNCATGEAGDRDFEGGPRLSRAAAISDRKTHEGCELLDGGT